MSLPSAEVVRGFLDGLGDTEARVAESLRALGARDAPGVADSHTGGVSIGRNCAVAMGLRIEFPELDADSNWVLGAFHVRLKRDMAEGLAGLAWMVKLPVPVIDLMGTVDEERSRLAYGERLTPTYPFLLAPKEGS